MTTWPDPVVVMVAPNGARRGKADHPALPLTIAETVAATVASAAAGASVLHAHVRDAAGAHSLDSGLYRELLAEMAHALPGFPVQVTTESAGRFDPAAQAALLADLRPAFASVALRELGQDEALAARAYHDAQAAGVAIQHILYDAADLRRFQALRRAGVVPRGPAALLFVLGRYGGTGIAQPADLLPFLSEGTDSGDRWWLCAFGPAEAACVTVAAGLGGHVRVGFENNLHTAAGPRATANADLVADALRGLTALGRRAATPAEAARLLACK